VGLVTIAPSVDVDLTAVGKETNIVDPDLSFLEDPPESTPLIQPAS